MGWRGIWGTPWMNSTSSIRITITISGRITIRPAISGTNRCMGSNPIMESEEGEANGEAPERYEGDCGDSPVRGSKGRGQGRGTGYVSSGPRWRRRLHDPDA